MKYRPQPERTACPRSPASVQYFKFGLGIGNDCPIMPLTFNGNGKWPDGILEICLFAFGLNYMNVSRTYL